MKCNRLLAVVCCNNVVHMYRRAVMLWMCVMHSHTSFDNFRCLLTFENITKGKLAVAGLYTVNARARTAKSL